ncbi:MAG: DNA polymerase III subunit delta' [Deltaproteobacteria bacterium]|nr:DNA polymerase III subunit delta' [Deltaproteobacteria bacterium]
MNILGHEKTLKHLLQLAASNKLPHALLFCGPEGIGKSLVALHFVQKMFCAGSEPCQKCPTCLRVQEKNHPDLLWIEPEKEVIKIEKVRQMKQWLSLKPLEACRKIIILRDAHALPPAAANALLKILEEPPSDVLIILITAFPNALLKTILSRAQKIYFQPLSPNQTAQVLALKNHVPNSELLRTHALSPGQWLSLKSEALELIEKQILPALNSKPRQLLQLLNVAQEISGDAETEKSVLTLLLWEWRKRILQNPCAENLEKFQCIGLSLKRLDRYANALLTFENLFLKLCL